MTNTLNTHRAAVTISSFYPFATNLKDRKVLVLGGGEAAYRETLRLIDAGALLTIVAAEPCDDIREILVTHASRAKHSPLSAGQFVKDSNLKDFALAFLLSDEGAENALAAKHLAECGVPAHFMHQPEKSSFVTATPLKRGHLKIAVSTDGLCQALERAISRRIEETFVYDFDQYSIFLSSLEEKLADLKAKNEEHWTQLNLRLEGEDFYLALTRKNFDEALRMVDLFVHAIETGAEDDDEVEINRPRKGGQK